MPQRRGRYKRHYQSGARLRAMIFGAAAFGLYEVCRNCGELTR
jgi:hypothetical protein